jgi:GT2 family glycosyltransferase
MRNVRDSDHHTARHRAVVLDRERRRLWLERLFGWRPSTYYQRLRVYYRRWRHLLPGPSGFLGRVFGRDPYAVWVREEARALSAVNYAERIATFSVRPTVSILVPVCAPVPGWLVESIRSVRAQSYPHWQLYLCPASLSAEVAAVLESESARDPRVAVVRCDDAADMAAALNRALALARGEYIGLLGQHDTLAPHALYEVVKRLQDARVDVCYSDEDAIDARGRRFAPFCKPDWSPDLAVASLYACRFGVYRRDLVMAVGGFRPGDAEGMGYDLLLRCTERSHDVVHIPRILYHVRRGRPLAQGQNPFSLVSHAAHSNATRALREALARRGGAADVEDGPAPGTFRIRYQPCGTPLVSIIIPTRDRLPLLRRCIQSIEARSTYRRYEVIVVDNGSREPHTLAYLRSISHKVIIEDGPFNFARLNNRAVRAARGDCLLFLNNDVEVVAPDWLEALLEHAQRQEVGAVGGLLLYADGTIQHAGVVLGVRGVAGHAHKYLPATAPGYGYFPHLVRNYSAVTAACLMMRKAVYEEVGGMEERLAITFNDVDLCLRLRARGYLIVYTPYARLFHHESRSRWYQPPRPEEVRYMLDRWGPLIARDPYYNPHLTLEREDFRFDLGRARAVLTEG